MSEEEIEQERINKEERLEKLEKCVERIKELLEAKCYRLKDYQALVEEIKWLVED